MTATNPDLANKFFTLEGEMIGDNGYVVKVDQAVFHLLENQVHVPTVAVITAAYAADVNTTQMGPYNAQEARTAVMKS